MPTDPDSGQRRPKYRLIEDEIARRIGSGRYRPGEALPAQRELCKQFGVTLMTLRQALQALSERGLVVQQPGRGTFVAPPPAAYRMTSLRSLAEELRGQGLDVHTRVLRRELREPPAYVGAALQLGAGAEVLQLQRLRLIGDTCVAHQSSWVPQPYASAVAGSDFAVTPLYEALAEICGEAVASATESVRPGVLPARLAATLRRQPGTAVFLSDRTTFGVTGAPLVFDRAVILGDRLEIRTERVSTAASMSWALLS